MGERNGEQFDVYEIVALRVSCPVVPILSLGAMMMQRSTVRRLAPRLGCVAGALVAFAATGCHRKSIGDAIRKDAMGEGVRFTAEASTRPDRADTVFLVLKATNLSSGYRTVWFSPLGRCGPSVAFANGRANATRVWRLELPPLPPGVREGCVEAGVAHIGPGTSVESFRTAVPVRGILGDSLPPGLYRAIIGGDAQLRGGFVTPEIALR